MSRSRDKTPDKLLTTVELELMNIIWSLGKCSVKDVAADLPKSRKLAYTTVATMLKILEQKKFLRCEKDSHAHVFIPVVSKESYEGACIEHMVASVFDGEPTALVQRLLSIKELSKAELTTIESALAKLSREEGKKP